MMPNPKVGTVTMDVATAVKGAKGGSVEFRVEKAGIVQAGIGKASFSADKLVQNIKAFADAVQKSKPSGAKGTYINRVAVSSTMGPGVKVEPSSLFARKPRLRSARPGCGIGDRSLAQAAEPRGISPAGGAIRAWQGWLDPLNSASGRAGPVRRRAFMRPSKMW